MVEFHYQRIKGGINGGIKGGIKGGQVAWLTKPMKIYLPRCD